MGLCGAPGTFQRVMDHVFTAPAHIDGKSVSCSAFVCVYLDDICIFSSSPELHLSHIEAVLLRLREHKLYAKPSKCEWAQSTIEFLGHQVSPSGFSIAQHKIDALQNWPAPRSVHDVRSCLGTFGFWRSYIPRYAHVTAPLSRLTRKDMPWRWGEVEQNALNELKRLVREHVVLMHADQEKPLIVVTDPSDFAVGASLEQTDANGKRRPVLFFSHGLSPAERKYPVHERELLATVLALRTWRHYLARQIIAH